MRSAFVDEINHGLEDTRIAVLVNTVAEVEDVARMSGVVVEHSLSAGDCRLGACKYEGRIKIPLHD